jgi:arylsulfatase A-like enzyme
MSMTSMPRLFAATAMAALLCAGHASAQDRSVLPIPPAAFDGRIAPRLADAQAATPQAVRAPQGAPNVFLFLSDDVGFAMTSAFGGPVPTPNFERLAQSGQRYNRFHTTGICSPTRAALLTGRNHHNAGTGMLSDLPTGFPGYGGRIGYDTATIAQVLRLNGWSTAMFGKHHNSPAPDRNQGSGIETWPTGLGFEYFYGFNGGDNDQFKPTLYRDRQLANEADNDRAGRLLDARFADDIISYIHNQKAGAPAKPFFVYFAPGSTHAPHQAPPEHIARFKGKFDHGWDAQRVLTWRRQLAMGIVPRGTRLTPRPEGLPAWDRLTPAQKAFHARQMEVAAAMLTYQDEQLGRIIDDLQRIGQYDNTLFAMVLGDNGASGEAGPRGTLNELRTIVVQDEREEWLYGSLDIQGGPQTYQNYSVAWAWAMNAPLPLVKQYASQLGGIRNGAILSWSGRVAKPGAVCAQFGHVVDIVPTVLEASGVPAPTRVLGTDQKPMDGQSLLASLQACEPKKPRTQYFELAGKIGLYKDGWFLSGENGRDSWKEVSARGVQPDNTIALYNLDKDFAQSTDLAAKMPEKAAEMLAEFDRQAKANQVYPLDHRFGGPRINQMAAFAMMPKHYDFWGKDVSIPAAGGAPFLAMRPFTVEADLVLDSPSASGAVVALGSRFGGWSLYLDKGRPALFWSRSTDPAEQFSVIAEKTLPLGKSTLTMRHETTRPGAPATIVLSAQDEELARLALPSNLLFPAGNGEMLDVGRDRGVTVTDYQTLDGRIEGDITHVRVDFD